MSSTSGTATCPNFKLQNQHKYRTLLISTFFSKHVAFYFAHIFNGPQNSPYKALKGIKMLQIEIKTFPNDFLEKKEKKKTHFFDPKNQLSDRHRFCPFLRSTFRMASYLAFQPKFEMKMIHFQQKTCFSWSLQV